MNNYLELLKDCLETGEYTSDRTGVGTLSKFGAQLRFDLSKGFPLVTTKKLHLKSVIHELLWFLSGDTNIKYLNDNGVRIWDDWGDENGDLGPVYGKQWRDFNGVDQISNLIEQLKNNPFSRRHLVSAWNPTVLDKVALPSCHALYQFKVSPYGKLSCQLYQRSADMFLGVPFNIASYALLTHMVAQVTGYEVGEFIHTFGDYHIYSNHIEQVELQLSREPYELPKLWLNPDVKNIFDFKYEDIKILDYKSHPTIKGKVAV